MRRIGRSVLAGMLALVPGVTHSETYPQAESAPSRSEELRRRRLGKEEDLHPYVPNKIERNLLKFDKAETPTIQEANFHGFYPRVAWIARGSGISFGTRY